MPTFHRRNGSVKYVPPRRLLEGLRPAVAIPATLFAALVVVGIAFALHKTPKEQKWVNLREEKAWKPALSDNGETLSADKDFLFERAIDRALTPRATRQGAIPKQPGEALAPAAGRVVWSGGDQMVIEHGLGEGDERRFVRTRVIGVTRANAGVGMVVQRGDLLAEGEAVAIGPAGAIQSLPAAPNSLAPEIRDSADDEELEPTFHVGR